MHVPVLSNETHCFKHQSYCYLLNVIEIRGKLCLCEDGRYKSRRQQRTETLVSKVAGWCSLRYISRFLLFITASIRVYVVYF